MLLAITVIAVTLGAVAKLHVGIVGIEFTNVFTDQRQRYQHRHSKQTVNFKKATKSAYQEKGYIHK